MDQYSNATAKLPFCGSAGRMDPESNSRVDGFADMCYTIPK